MRLAYKVREGATVLDGLHQSGSARARFPSPRESGPGRGQAQAILLNMAGGLTGGDRFSTQVALDDGADATVTSAAAEKVYRARDAEPARIDVSARLAAGARLNWLPQSTILFDRSVLERRTSFELAEDATLLAGECLIFGRAAMGEDVARGAVIDRWQIRRGGRLIFADVLRLAGCIAEALDRPATFAGARATAMLVYIGKDAARRLDQVRALVASARSSIGASQWGEILLVRGLAKDGRTLQTELRPVIEALSGRGLPRIWQC
ncbi:MAG: urease accessory protein UreD [Hyphomicrobiaceae bacterium]|nr:urease accessory protein UreD [Hyphomicrobiaceae bacterium]